MLNEINQTNTNTGGKKSERETNSACSPLYVRAKIKKEITEIKESSHVYQFCCKHSVLSNFVQDVCPTN